MTQSKIAHDIKHRKVANDEFYTPDDLVKFLISLCPFHGRDSLLDPAYGKGAFYDAFPKDREVSYLTKKDDFLHHDEKYDWLITNPPYSLVDDWLEHSCDVANKGFAYLLGLHNLTPRRMEICEKRGFYISKIHICKVFKWYGISAFVVWEKSAEKRKVEMTYDRKVWY